MRGVDTARRLVNGRTPYIGVTHSLATFPPQERRTGIVRLVGCALVHSVLALASIQGIGLLPQVRRQRLDTAAASWLIVEPLQSFLHKTSYPLLGMATTQAHRCG